MELTRLTANAASFLMDVSLRSLLLFFVAGLVLLFMRRASAAGRHLLWTMTVGSLLLLPILCAWFPRWDTPILPSATTASLKTTAPLRAAANVQQLPGAPLQKPLLTLPDDARGSIPSAALVKTPASAEKTAAELTGTSMPHRLASQASVPVPEPLASRPAPLRSQPFAPTESVSFPAWGVSAGEWLVGLWLIGVLLALCRTTFSLLAARRLLRGSRLVTEGALVEVAMEAGGKLSLSTPMILKAGTAAMPVAIPMTFGVIRPVVLMPTEAAFWPAERLWVVFLHEAAHVKRLDWITAMLAQVVCALYWFHPLVWLASHRLRVESEQACDDIVLGSGVQAVEYADHLVEVVRRLAGRRVSSAVVTMAYSQEVTGRLKTILAGSKNRTATTSRGLTLATLATLVVVTPLAAMHPVAKLRLKNPSAVETSRSRTALLPDGTQIKLVQIVAVNAENRANPYSPAWSPDGSPSLWNGRTQDEGYVNSGIEMLTGRNRAQTYGYARLDMVTSPRRDVDAGEPRFLPREVGYADITVPLAMGPYTPLVSGPSRRSTSRRLGTGEVVTLSKVMVRPPADTLIGRSRGPVAEVDLTLPDRFLQGGQLTGYRFNGMGQDGKPILLFGFSGPVVKYQGHGMTRLAFTSRMAELTRRKVAGFSFSYRAVYSVTFRNVALKPKEWAASAPTPLQSALADAPIPITPSQIAGDTRWQSVLPNGTQVRLTQVTAIDSKNDWTPYGTAWSPDGTTIPSDRPIDREGFGGERETMVVLPSHPGTPPTYGALFLATRPQKRFSIGDTRLILRPSGRADAIVTVAMGPYKTLIEGSAKQGAKRRLPTGEIVTLSPMVPHSHDDLHENGKSLDVTSVSLTVPHQILSGYMRGFFPYALVALGPDGQPVSVPHASSSLPMWQGHGVSLVRYMFRTAELADRKVTGFRFLYRPVYSVTFRDVALRPRGGGASPAPPQRPQPSQDLNPSGVNPLLPDSIGIPSGDTGTVLPPRIVFALGGDAPWKRTLSDGTQVKMMSVTSLDAQYSPIQTWKPDGTPLDTGATSQVTPTAPAHLSYQFLVVCPSVRQMIGACMAYGRVGDGASPRNVPPWRRQRWAVLNDPESMPIPQKITALQVNVATGPETTLISGSPLTGAVRRLPTGEMVILSKAILHSPGEAHQDGHPVDTTEVDFTLPTRFVHNTSEYNFVIVGQDGKPLSAQHGGGGMPIVSGRTAQMRYDFRTSEVPLARVREFRLTFRPSRAAIFKGFAVRPRVKTAMVVPTRSTPPVTPILSQTQDPFNPDPAVIGRTRENRIKAAVSLRQYLYGWALQHAALLRQMRRARSVDIPGILRVVPQMSLPNQYPYDLHDGSQSPSGGLVFASLNAPVALPLLREFQRSPDRYTREDLAKCRDFRLLESKNAGRSHITLWASGRVTETTLVQRSDGHDQPNLTERVESLELAPPYEFLFPQSSF